ncbi:MAG: preprotein translocase subunit SecG [Desulfurivibrio sp.]|nr:preprotein translocase subunit SecG [Desulfurivibrio sp.]MBU3936822.1 preprotein translocase subunit SecG [Pseudomonadota bacterium]MBU4117906.1 preprotein translocase subunit SecG [Pseudomonadota bacterium]
MTNLLTIVHIAVSLFLIVIVLLQHGKGASMGAAFGGSSQTVFGTEGPLPLLNKITTWAAILFMLTSISLAYMSSKAGDGSVMKEVAPISEPQNLPIPLPATEGVAPQVPVQDK